MKFLFLGTSAGWPLPRLGCSCEICSSSDPKDKRLRPSLLINDELLLDAGPDIYHELIRAKTDLSKLKALAITHGHHDHIFGLHDLTKIYERKYQEIPVFVTIPILNSIKRIFTFPLSPLKLTVVKENEQFDFNNYKMTFVSIEHGGTPAYAIKVKRDKLLAYIPDFRRILPNSEKTLRDLNFLILDGSSLSRIGQAKGHITIEEGIEIGKKLKAKNVFFTHIGHKVLPHEDLENFVQSKGGRNFHIAYDGLEAE